jgi:hypothetical protein
MARYAVRVVEVIDHTYIIEADNREDALDKYAHLTDGQLADMDKDGDSTWDKPWDVEELTDGED